MEKYCQWVSTKEKYLHCSSSDAGDGIFRLWWVSIPCLLMPWLLKSPEHQQVWYWLCRTVNMYCYSTVNFTNFGRAKFKMQFKMQIYLLQSLKQISTLRANTLELLLFGKNLQISNANTLLLYFTKIQHIKDSQTLTNNLQHRTYYLIAL